MTQEIVSAVIQLGVLLIGGVITSVVIPALTKWINAKTSSQLLQSVIYELDQTAQQSVNYVQQTFVNQLKIDGKWNSDNQKEALKLAVEVCIQDLSTSTSRFLEREGTNIRELVERHIESRICKSKKEGAL